jgi:hypothetical protein
MAAKPGTRCIRSLVLIAVLTPATVSAQTDLSGLWRPLLHEDVGHRIDERAAGGPLVGDGAGGPRLGDYTGLPLNDAARLRADSFDPRISAAREHQTILHPGAYWIFPPGGMRLSTIVDDASQRATALVIYRAGVPGSTTRTIWLDGRDRPPEFAAHTWQGFSTGRWMGEVLVVETTHLKAGFIRRNGVPVSDRATVTEHLVRHGAYITVTRIVQDPVYLEEPSVASSSWIIDPTLRIAASPAGEIVDEVPGQGRAFVPHFLPGANPVLREFAAKSGLPAAATRGGPETQYPEYQRTLKDLIAAQANRGTR